MRRTIAIALSASAAAGCMAPRKKSGGSDLRTYNGAPVTSSTDPTMKSTVVLLMGGKQAFCSGVLMDTGLIVAAAHCFHGIEAELAQAGVSIGFGAGPNYDAVIPVSSAYVHAEYAVPALGKKAEATYEQQDPAGYARLDELVMKEKSGSSLSSSEDGEMKTLAGKMAKVMQPILAKPGIPVNDIALLRFDGATPPYARDVDIATGSVQGRSVIAAGYVVTSVGPSKSGAGILYRLKLSYTRVNQGGEELLVKGANGTGSCRDDTGGPSYVDVEGTLYALAIASRGTLPHPACGGDTKVFTDLRSHLSWLQCHAGRLAGSGESLCDVGVPAQGTLIAFVSGGVDGSGGGVTRGCLNEGEARALLLCAVAEKNGGLGPAEQIQCESFSKRYLRFSECS